MGNNYFNVILKAQNLRLEHFESYSSFSYCMHSSVYRVFWSSSRVIDCKILNLFRHQTTGPEHPLYSNMQSVNMFMFSVGGTDPKVEIWFLDRGMRWHYITDSFMAYYRLMIMHLGLPQWQYAFTDIGLSQQAKVNL